jgi:acetyltransferase-like isoleucine patch superfamily enzyme
MKTQPIDYLLSTLILTLLTLLAWGLAALCARGFTIAHLGDYHAVADVLLFLVFFGLAAALFCRALVSLDLLPVGRHDMSSAVFTRWKLFTVVYEFGRGALLPVTTLFFRPVVAKLFGARIGRDIALGGRLVDPQFITVGDYAILGQDSVITAHTIVSGQIVLDPVRIGARATVGVKVVIMSGVNVGEGAVIAAGAVVPPNTTIPPGELWGGIPARKLKDLAAS